MTLFDSPEAARDEALVRVEEHADRDWLNHAAAIVEALPPGDEFTTDTVWRRLGLQRDEPLPETHEPRALGAVMMGLARRRVIVKTGRYQPTTRKAAHARPIPVWRRTL